jgi:Transposase and inactivated derivatives
MNQLTNLDLSFNRIAILNNVSTTLVLLYLDSYVSIPNPMLPKSIGIDELYSKKMSLNNSSYLCILTDNINKYPFDILPSRSKNTLNSHFSKYSKAQKDNVLFVTIDMWLPYKDVALRHFKNAKIAVDPFHVVKTLTHAFSKIRVSIQNNVDYNSDTYYLLKQWHFLLDKTDINLDNEPKYNKHFRRKLNYRSIYNMLLEISDKLTLAYKLKYTYQLFNQIATSDNCEAWFDRIIYEFSISGISEYNDFTQMLCNWREEIINSFLRPYDDRKLSNAISENINSKIRAYLGLVRGTSNFIRFRKRVLLALNDKVFYSISDRLVSNKAIGKPRGNYIKK